MEYNTSLSKLIIPEYGRNVQKMVHSIIDIENREKRNHQAKSIIEVMGNLNPHLRDVPDFKHKLWDHLFIMSDFHLDVDSPYDRPSKESFEEACKYSTFSSVIIENWIIDEPIKDQYDINRTLFSYRKTRDIIFDKIHQRFQDYL